MNPARPSGPARLGRVVIGIHCVLLLFLVALAGLSAAKPLNGNTRSRVYHQSSCRYYACPNCTARFDSAREALDSGYRPCGLCDPATRKQGLAEKGAAPYVGNTRSHKLHKSSCRYAGCANCTARFHSRKEAIEAGYSPGGCCNP